MQQEQQQQQQRFHLILQRSQLQHVHGAWCRQLSNSLLHLCTAPCCVSLSRALAQQRSSLQLMIIMMQQRRARS
jgi:hypothetical protein